MRNRPCSLARLVRGLEGVGFWRPDDEVCQLPCRGVLAELVEGFEIFFATIRGREASGPQGTGHRRCLNLLPRAGARGSGGNILLPDSVSTFGFRLIGLRYGFGIWV